LCLHHVSMKQTNELNSWYLNEVESTVVKINCLDFQKSITVYFFKYQLVIMTGTKHYISFGKLEEFLFFKLTNNI